MRRRFCRRKPLLSSGLGAVTAIGVERIAEDAPALFCDAPTSCARHFNEQAAHMQALQEPADGSALAVALRVAKRFGIEDRTDVFIAKSLRDVIPGEHGGDQAALLFPSRVEARV